ncbi:unnamed protein product, partial [Didymodactylos carnosus]
MGKRWLSNSKQAAKLKFDLSFILSDTEMAVLRRYAQQGGSISTIFFSVLPVLAHFGRNSFYESMFHSTKPFNLFSVVVGPSGASKSPNIKFVKDAAVLVSKLFSDEYIRDVKVGEKSTAERNSVTSSPNHSIFINCFTHLDVERKKIMAICQKILETKSPLMTDTDITKITSHYDIQNRTAAKNKLIEQQLIKKDLYLATANKTGNSIKTCPGYVKCFPLCNSITEKEQFSQHLAEYGIKLQDYLKLCEDNKQIRTDTNYGLS